MGTDSGAFLKEIARRRVRLVVLEGAQKGTEFAVESEHITVGSAQGNSVVLTDGTVSRHHAEIETSANGLVVRDRGSRNGTFLDGNRIKEAFLYPGCRLRFGSTTVSVT